MSEPRAATPGPDEADPAASASPDGSPPPAPDPGSAAPDPDAARASPEPDTGPVDRSIPYADLPKPDRLAATPARSTSANDPPGLRDIATSAVDATLAVGSVAIQGFVGVSAMVLRRVGSSPPARWTKQAAASALDTRNSELTAVGRAAEEQINKIIAVFVPVVVDSIDPSALLARVDVDAILDKVDVDALLDRVDVNALLDRVDVNALVDRIDIDKMLDGVDLQALMERANIGDIVAQSTSQMAGSTLDVGRRQVVGLDTVMMRVVDRALGRNAEDQPLGPPDLVPTNHETEVE
jgi:hypothetical protein